VRQDWLLGLDVGGGSIRCALVDADTGEAHLASRPFRAFADPEAPAGSRFDPRITWQSLIDATAEVMKRSGAAPEAVRGVACASMRHASVLVDDAGEVLLATSNRDARGMSVAFGLPPAQSETLLARTGRWPNPILPALRLCWLAQQRPDLLERAAAHLAISDWIGLRLSGELASDPTQAGESLCLDLARRAWADDLIADFGLPRGLFPSLREPGTRLGRLREDAARELGLPAGLPVGMAGADTQCAAIGCGALEVGETIVVAGTTAPLQRLLADPLSTERLWAGPAASAGRFALESNAGGLGESATWLAELLYPEHAHPILRLLDEAARGTPGAAGLLSTFGADVMNARALEMPLGHLVVSPLSAPDAATRRVQLARAGMEGMAFALRANLEQLDEAAGPGALPLHVVGGLARSPFFTRLLADVCAAPVTVPRVAEATVFGAALCAGVAAGRFGSLAEASETCVSEGRRCDPDAEAAACYRDIYPTWREVREAQAASRSAAGGHALRALMTDGGASHARAEAPRPSVLVASDMDARSLDRLRERFEVEYASFRDAGRLLTGDALVEAVRGVDVLVTEIDVVNAEALVRCRDLRAIAVCRGDAVNVDLAACSALGIPVLNTPGRNADAVADLTLAFLLALARKLIPAHAFLHEPGGEAGDLGRMGRAFVTFQGRELWRRTVGLVGLGAVGRKVVERLAPFGARCLVHDPFLPGRAIRLCGAEPASLDALLAESDFVSLHAPVTDATRGMLGDAEFARMRAGSALVNTARAALVDEAALERALASGHLAGAALDVFAVEPPASEHPLLALPNVIATPHVGGNTVDVAAHQGEIVADDLLHWLAGGAPRHLLNPETLSGFSWTDPRPEPPPDLLERLGDGPGPAVTDLARDARK
jgi:autoinducer 2 (AI-2) kinase